MITMLFGALLLASMAVALSNWRHGWLAAVLCGILQDPVRKLTPGTPAVLTMSIVAVYAVILFAALGALQRNRVDFARRFPNLYSTIALFLAMLVFAAMNGLATFGLSAWKVPALSFLIYLLPIPAVLLGYSWLTREEQLVREIEGAAERGKVGPSNRTKFQVIALLMREERAHAKADTSLTDAERVETLKRLDGVATILAKTAARDTSLIALLAEDALPRRDHHRGAGHGGTDFRSAGMIDQPGVPCRFDPLPERRHRR